MTAGLPVQRDLAGLFRAALDRAVASGALALDPDALPEPTLERPRLPEHGDWATNVTLVLAKAAKAPPRAVAEAMVGHLELPEWVAEVEVAGPGFVNVRLDQRWFAGLVRRVLAEGRTFGTVDLGHGERVNVEFISANPTGSLHVGNARLAPMGDALANLLTATGHKVEREYYINFEHTLHETGAIAETVDDLRERGVVEDRDGAVWLRTTLFGDAKDQPLIRSNGAPTSFGADAAYYRDKRRRGFDRLLFLWGADHHGYVPRRMRAVVRAFGDPDDTAEFLIGQLVSVVRAGQPAKMSRRAGDIATVDDLLDEVGKDAFRYTMLRFSLDAPIEFDVEAVTRQSLDNPVYYVRYAYARIASVLRQGSETGFTALPVEEADLGLLDHPMEAALLRRLAAFEEQVVMAAVQRAPHRLTRYAEELAAAFHRFYAECRVLGDDHALSSARWWLVKATGQVLGNTLALIGVDAPERM